METIRELLEAARRLWQNPHGRYEEMCALAATGQLGGAEMYELNLHIAGCDSCRKFLESVAQVSVQVIPLLADSRVQEVDIVQADGMRARFLERFAAEGLQNDVDVPALTYAVRVRKPLSAPTGVHNEVGSPFTRSAKSSMSFLRLCFPLRRSVIVATGVVIAIAGLYVGVWRTWQSRHRLIPAAPLSMAASQENASQVASHGSSARVSQLESQNAALETEVGKLKHELSNATSGEQSLSGKLEVARHQLAALTTTIESTSQQSMEEHDAAKNRDAALQSQIDTLHREVAEYDFKLDMQKQASKELAANLETAQAQLQLERDLRSPQSELGELVSARNLHIVDVYDADPNGDRQRSFGRVFYIEGKSLVFYAYDLSDSRRFKANMVFYVWGGNANTQSVTHRLGILRKEDDGQSRWAMTFDDPQVLGQINTVFVTAEPTNRHYDEPHGKKVLYAYFGNPPNHK
jgi:hypothetical protein